MKNAARTLALLTVISITATAVALVRRFNQQGPGPVQLPFMATDGKGNNWMVFQPWLVQMQGNFPVFAQAGALQVNNTQPNGGNQARVDEKTKELIIENMPAGQCTVTRRVLFSPDDSYIRIVDQFKNSTQQDQQVIVGLTSSIAYGIQSSQMIVDPKKANQNIGWVGTVAAGPARAALELYAEPGAKLIPQVDNTNGNNVVQASMTLTVPAGKELALAHFHVVTTSQDAGLAWVAAAKTSRLFADLPGEVRREIVNFRVHNALLGDLDALRGDVLDVVELRTGDRYNGNLTETSYKLDTSYGPVELPVDKVVSIVNVGQFRPRQLMVTADGQIFGGHLEKDSIGIELSSGQKTQIPLAQISRIGYRHRSDDKDDSSGDDQLQPPYLLMGSGDRVGVKLTDKPITVVTRYGSLEIAPAMIAGIVFNSDDSGVHTVNLMDGSHFSGLVTGDQLEVKLTTAAKDDTVKLPIGAINQVVLQNPPDQKDDGGATINVKKDDLLSGTLQGQLKLDTAFDTIAINAPEIRAINHGKNGGGDLTITTWDGTMLTGQLQETTLACKLNCGLSLTIPAGLLESYTNPSAAVPEIMATRIKQIVTNLNADDWKDRDTAEQQLIKIGPGVVPLLKQMRDTQPPESQQRIDSVVKQLAKQS